MRDRRRRMPRRLLLFLYTLLVFASGVLTTGYLLDRLHGSGLSIRGALGRLQSAIASVPGTIRAAVSKPDVEQIDIEIKLQDYAKLSQKRSEALAAFHLEAREDDYVPVTIRHGDETVRASIRLKGDWIDHLTSDKWSFRIKLRGDDTLFGMKRFSIQHPRTRNYLYEWLYHRALSREGLVALRYDFIRVKLNGGDLGLYALEEHFEKRLVEHRRRPTGPVVRFDEGLMFRIQRQYGPFREINSQGGVSNTADSTTLEPYLSAEIDAFQSAQARSDPMVRAQHLRAIRLLEGFRRGELQTSQVFDVMMLARFFALSDLLGAHHSSQWRNMRFYYNPITSRLEPIAFDGDAGARIRRLGCVVDADDDDHAPIGERRGPFLQRVFEDLDFFEEYVRALARYAERSYLEALWADLDEELERKKDLLHSEFPRFDFSKGVIERNQEYLRVALDPPQALHAYYKRGSATRVDLQLGNIQALPIEILGLVEETSMIAAAPPNTVLSPASVAPPRPVEYVPVQFHLPLKYGGGEKPSESRLKVRFRILGTEDIRERGVVPWPHSWPESGLSRPATSRANFESFDFLVVNEAAHEIFIKPGDWPVDRDLVFPAGYRVIAHEGTRLSLSNSAAILSYSPLYFVGTSDNPIVVQSKDDTGQGLMVLNAADTSTLDHVAFHNLSSLKRNDWELTGAVTFYESPVEILNSSFTANRSEDALHIVRSRFAIDRSLFRQAQFDALDADFSDGSIRESHFVDAGNDAIDLSGSQVELQSVVVDGSGDKALSAGERSLVRAQDLSIRRAEISAASKDSSTITAIDMRISDCGIGLTAFRKKTEFGPGRIDVRGLQMIDVATPYLVETLSSVEVEGKRIPATEQDVRSRLYDPAE